MACPPIISTTGPLPAAGGDHVLDEVGELGMRVLLEAGRERLAIGGVQVVSPLAQVLQRDLAAIEQRITAHRRSVLL